MSDNFSKILIGEIVAAQGIRGQVRVNAYTDNPADIVAYGEVSDVAGKAVPLQVSSTKNRQVIASIRGIGSREAAEGMVGTKLYIPRAALPETAGFEAYYADLIGLEVWESDKKIGIIKAMHDFGAGDVMEVMLGNGKVEMFLYKQVVREVRLAEGYITIDMPDSVTVQS